MRRLAAGALFVTLAALSGTGALACGDKLLAIGRGVRFQRTYAARQANLVIYAAADERGASIGGAKLQTTLRQAVHNLQIVTDGPQLDDALKSGQVDLVLVDFADLAGITRQLQSAPSKPVVLPILVRPSKAEFAAAQREYTFALKATADDLDYLAAIDQAMKTKLKRSAKS